MACEQSCLGLATHPTGASCCHTCAHFDGQECAFPNSGYFAKHWARYLYG